MLDRLDGLLLPGSPSNVHPDHYAGGESRTPDLHDLERDATTLRLIPAAIARGMPVLAICRGIQELNVALGGTLHQTVHAEPGRFDHRGQGDDIEARYAPRHLVDLVRRAGAAWSGRAKILVNSLHGQAIDQVAPGLVVEALAPDGTIEAVRLARTAEPAAGLTRGWSACNGTRNGATRTIRQAWRSSARLARRAGPIRQDCERRHEMDLGLAARRR